MRTLAAFAALLVFILSFGGSVTADTQPPVIDSAGGSLPSSVSTSTTTNSTSMGRVRPATIYIYPPPIIQVLTVGPVDGGDGPSGQGCDADSSGSGTGSCP